MSLRHTFSLTSAAPPLPPPDCLGIVTLYKSSNDKTPLARLLLPPTFIYTEVAARDDAALPAATPKKKKDQSKYQKKFSSQHKPFVSIKTLAAAHEKYLVSILSSLGDEIPTALYAPNLGVSFLSALQTKESPTTHIASLSYHSCPNLLHLLPSKTDYEEALGSSTTALLSGKERAQKIISTFLNLVRPAEISPFPTPAPPTPITPKITPPNGSTDTELPPPLVHSCPFCGKLRLKDLSSAVHHLKSKHFNLDSVDVSPEIWKMHCPTTDRPNITTPPNPPAVPIPPLKVAYIDPFVAIIVKPQGIAVQGGSGHGSDDNLAKSDLLLAVSYSTSANAFKGWANEDDYSTDIIGHTIRTPTPSTFLPRPSTPLLPDDPLGKVKHAHRIDRATGGLLICSRTKRASALVAQLFQDKSLIQKRYRSIVLGSIEEDSGVIENPIDGKKR